MDLPLSEVKGIGPARLKALADAGITSVRELVMDLPREYRDLRESTPLCEAKAGESAAYRVQVAGDATEQRARRLLHYPGVCHRWHGNPDGRVVQSALAEKTAAPGTGAAVVRQGWRFAGGRCSWFRPPSKPARRFCPCTSPFPACPRRCSGNWCERALAVCEGQWPDELPEGLKRKYGLCERNFAMRSAHFPESREALDAARRRIAFEELLLYQVALSLFRSGVRTGVPLEIPQGAEAEYWKKLRFPPTGAQKRVLLEIGKDMRAERAHGPAGAGRRGLRQNGHCLRRDAHGGAGRGAGGADGPHGGAGKAALRKRPGAVRTHGHFGGNPHRVHDGQGPSGGPRGASPRGTGR